jgi:hypothetical protein
MIYAGIGSRETPFEIINLMRLIGQFYARNGWLLRSGGARGADDAFEQGCDERRGPKEIFTPRMSDSNPAWEQCASAFHPAWERCNPYARKLHARNMPIVLGCRLDQPAACVVCWTKGGGATGGTGQALRAAAHYGVPVFNLFNHDLRDWYERNCLV